LNEGFLGAQINPNQDPHEVLQKKKTSKGSHSQRDSDEEIKGNIN
jgi:hypothetical protein